MDGVSEFLDQHFQEGGRLGIELTHVADVGEVVRRTFGDIDLYFTPPKKMFLKRPREQVVAGYPIVRSVKLVNALYAYLQHEVNNQVALVRKQSALGSDEVVSGREYEIARNEYRDELQRTLEACILNSFGQKFTELFWLDHSMDVGDALSKVRKKVVEIDSAIGKQYGEGIRYRVYGRFTEAANEALERVLQSLGDEFKGFEADYRSPLYRLMRDNVLCFTEFPTRLVLEDLEGFIRGYLNRDYDDFAKTLGRLRETAQSIHKKDALFRKLVTTMWPTLEKSEQASEDKYLFDSRYRELLFAHPKFNPKHFSREFQDLLGNLAKRLVQYDFIHFFRALIQRCAKSKEHPGHYCLEADKGVVFDEATRPYNFGHRTILDNFVQRYGLVYDITSFSQTYFDIKARSSGEERASARQMFNFQETLATLPIRYPIRFEKFLGDGSFYSARAAMPLLKTAVVVQETYAQACAQGFAFNKGLRIALNYSYYYLLPLRNQASKQGLTYDFFGPGLIELTRLTSGKTTKEVEELKDLLIGHGYPVEVVHKFFSHIERVLATERSSSYRAEIEDRKYYVLVDEKGNLTNEGILATRQFIEGVAAEADPSSLRYILWRNRRLGGIYAGDIDRWIAMREAGLVKVKGLDPFMVYEIIAFTPEQLENGDFAEERFPAGMSFNDAIFGEEGVGESRDMTEDAHVVGDAEPEVTLAVEEPELEVLEEVTLNPTADVSAAAPVPDLGHRAEPPSRPVQALASEASSSEPLEIACFIYEIEPGKGKCFVIGRLNRTQKCLENAIIEPKVIRISDKARIANIYRQLEKHPKRSKERIDLKQYAKAKDFKLVLLGQR